MRRSGRVLLLTLLLTGAAAELQSGTECPVPDEALVIEPDADGNPALAMLAPPDGPTPPFAGPQTLRDRRRAAQLHSELRELAGKMMIPVKGIAAADLRDTFYDPRGGGRHHHAIDIMAPEETPVLAATAGRVMNMLDNGSGGMMVFAVDASERFMFLYAHLDDYADELKPGQALKQGQVIGYVGATGNASSDAPHLHFAIKRVADGDLRWGRGKVVDPLPLLMPPDVASR